MEAKTSLGLKKDTSIKNPLYKGKKYVLSFKISSTDQDAYAWNIGAAFMLDKVGRKGRASEMGQNKCS
jgi:hypothetical protein